MDDSVLRLISLMPTLLCHKHLVVHLYVDSRSVYNNGEHDKPVCDPWTHSDISMPEWI